MTGRALLVGALAAAAGCSGTPTAATATPDAPVLTVPSDTPPVSAAPPAVTPTVPPPVPPSTASSTWVSVFGDTGWCGSAAMPRLAALLAGLSGDILLAGDLAYPNGTLDEFQRCFDPDFGRFKSRSWAAPGNHDYATAGADGYFTYFGDRAGPDRRGYHAVRAGTWHVLMLNTNVPTARGSAQIEWVRQEIRQNPTRCAMAVMHHPFDSSGPNGANPWLRDMWGALHELGVDLVVAGHDHLYERHAPQDANQRADPAGGIRLFIAGTGGARPYERARAAALSEVVISTFGLLRLKLEPALYEWEFLGAGGAVLDRGLNICH